MTWIFAGLLTVLGIPIAFGGLRAMRAVLRTFPVLERRKLDGLFAGKPSVIEGFARGQATLQAPLTGEPCLAWEIRGVREQRTGLQHSDTVWVPAGKPIAQSQAFDLEDEEGTKRVHIHADAGVTFGGFGEPTQEHAYGEDDINALHRRMDIPPGHRTMLRMWVIEPLDQCTVVGVATVREGGGWAILPRARTGKVVLIPGSAAAATKKVLVPALGWGLLGVSGLGMIVAAIALVV